MVQTEAQAVDLSDYKGRARPFLIFAPTIDHDGYVRQKQMLAAQQSAAIDRDLVLIEIAGDRGGYIEDRPLDPAAANQLRSDFNVDLDEFAVILLGKDGREKLRAHRAVPAHRLFDLIDSVPMRESEARGATAV